VLRVHRDGFGFVQPLTGQGEDIYLPRGEAQRAMDNDLVRVEVYERARRREGRLLEVLERRRRNAVGIYFERGKGSYVLPRDPAIAVRIRVPKTQLARDGDLVRVRIAERQPPGAPLSGEVAGSLGKPGDSSAEVLSFAFAEGFSDEFPPAVMDAAAAIPPEVTAREISGGGRRDLRALPLVTIDGEDARDFDDAVYAEPRGQGWRLVVAIADVSHYVREGSSLDAEALGRATSVYLPNRVLPMLPERLSNGICSLVPGQDRLCLVADLAFDRGGKLLSSDLYPGVMRSAGRCTYDEVQTVLEGGDVPSRNAYRENFERLQKLARSLTRMRELRGAIDFDLPERKVVLDGRGNPLRIERRERKESHRIIEECMLAANEAVAGYFRRRRLPTIYRYHGEPDEEKLAAFAALANAHGFKLGSRGKISSRDLNLFLEKLEDHPEQRALNQLLLRSMMQAVYTAESVGHYGLAAEHYLHYTSPIRRYPDLIVHRLLRAHWTGQASSGAGASEEQTEALEEIALRSSERERAALQVERRVSAYYSVLLMKDRIGDEFFGTVSALTDFGFFVELDDPWVEGLVKGDSLGRFRFEKEAHLLTFGSGLKVRVGQRARVRLVSANLQRRQLDFELLESSAPPRKRDKQRHERRGGAAPAR
jgi:ribonuclease R